jgi:protein TonB
MAGKQSPEQETMAVPQPVRGYNPSRRPRWWLVGLLLLAHALAGVLLARLLAPDFTASVIERATSVLTVTITAPDEPENDPAAVENPEPDEGAAAEAGKQAEAKEVMAPENPLPMPTPAPRAASTGNENSAGARDEGEGTGAGGEGLGTGSGRSGQGRGGIPVKGPTVKSGSIDSARDFPIPEGGRAVREGTSVTVVFTVGVDGRASNCSVSRPGPDPATNALVCPLVIERIRFNPATDANGNPVPARYGWRQDFFRR